MTLNVPNLDKLIAHLEAQPPERINMAWFEVEQHKHCGTAGCIGGHILLIGRKKVTRETSYGAIVDYLGLDIEDSQRLAYPADYHDDFYGVRRYPAHRVIATLKRLRDHYLASGEIVVDWGPEPTAGEPWAAPQAIELTPPALPAEITRLLEPAKVEV